MSGARSGPRPPPSLRRFVELFDDGLYWEAHEALEGPWRANRSALYHGLILFASGFVHAMRGNRHGVIAQMEKAERRLDGLPAAYLGVDLEYIRAEARAWIGLARRHADADWSQGRPVPRLVLAPERIRGDEPELDSAP